MSEEGRVVVPYDGTPRALDTILDEAFSRLATEVAEREGLVFDRGHLAALEEDVVALKLDREQDEIEWWTAVMELAAVAGECAREARGGSWSAAAMGSDELDELRLLFPIMFDGEDQVLDAVNVARDALAGLRASMVESLDIFLRDGVPRDEGWSAVPLLEPSSSGCEAYLKRPLLESFPLGPVVIVADFEIDGHAVILPADHDVPAPYAKQRWEEALAFLSGVDVVIEKLDFPVGKGCFVHGDYFAAEKILDQDFMRRIHAELGQKRLAVAIPCRGLMVVAEVADQAIQELSETARRYHGEAVAAHPEAQPITPELFEVVDGLVVAQIQDSAIP
ncbi:MAG: hypothetical protein KC731_42510 [Myxococcales bacterium]|nr:hypothetical protein [Myxococcales bacterium]